MIKLIFVGILAYLMGSVTFGMIVPRLMGTSSDVRKMGSGNVGATNVLRTQGKLQGGLVLAGDLLKGFLASMVGLWIAGFTGGCVAGVCAMLGHCFPLYYGFKGGKGVATAAGVVLALFAKSMLILLPVFILTILLSRMVSLGSLAGVTALLLCLLLFRPPAPMVFLSVFTAVMIVWKHKDNMKRILAGTENKIWGKARE